jgi:hypothetical protein
MRTIGNYVVATPVYIDNCAWDYLFAKRIDLALELPRDSFKLYITREVEIEVGSIPDTGKDGSDKRSLKKYILESIHANQVQTTSVFGFASHEPNGSLSKTQVYGGFGQGIFQSSTDRDWFASKEVQARLRGKPVRPSGLSVDQADASLAVRSFGAIVLTNERKGKPGPLSIAAAQGGRVVHLSCDVEPSGLSLGQYLKRMMMLP